MRGLQGDGSCCLDWDVLFRHVNTSNMSIEADSRSSWSYIADGESGRTFCTTGNHFVESTLLNHQ